MPLFIKTEKFKDKTLALSHSERKIFLSMHKDWVRNVSQSGQYILSGYLVNNNKEKGGGGLLIIEAKDYESARELIKMDPMIKNELVTWELQEWILIKGIQSNFFNHLG